MIRAANMHISSGEIKAVLQARLANNSRFV